MRLLELSYSIKVRLPLRLGSGVQVGNVLTFNRALIDEGGRLLLVPGNTLRGLILSSAMKLSCARLLAGEEPSKLCTVTGKCDEACPIKRVLSNSATEGAVFHFGVAELRGHHVLRRVHAALARGSRTSVVGVSPYVIEVLDSELSEDRRVEVLSRITVLGEDRELASVLKRGIVSTVGSCLGGKRTWGYGLVERAAITSERVLSLEEEASRISVEGPEAVVVLETPMPLDPTLGRDPCEVVRRVCEGLLSEYFASKCSVRAALSGAYRLVPIFWWDEALNRPHRGLALSRGTKVSLVSDEDALRRICALAEHVGLAPAGRWYSKCGYGVGVVERG